MAHYSYLQVVAITFACEFTSVFANIFRMTLAVMSTIKYL